MENFNELASLIVNAIVRDSAAQTFFDATAKQREEIVMAYVESEVKKFAKFACRYHTEPEFKAQFLSLFSK